MKKDQQPYYVAKVNVFRFVSSPDFNFGLCKTIVFLTPIENTISNQDESHLSFGLKSSMRLAIIEFTSNVA